MNVIKDILYDFGRAMPFLMTALFYHAFFLAYSSPEKAVIININMFGEAFIEAIILTISIPIMVYSIRRSRNESKRKIRGDKDE